MKNANDLYASFTSLRNDYRSALRADLPTADINALAELVTQAHVAWLNATL